MATFTFTPDFELAQSSEPRVRRTQFMDGGYEHRLRFGLNTNPKVYNLVFQARSDSERDQILAFFDDAGGAEAFDWNGVIDRRNLLSYTDDVTQSVWTRTNITTVGSGLAGYTGGSNAFSLIPNTTNGAHFVSQVIAVPANTNTVSSVFVKQSTGRDGILSVHGTLNFHSVTLNFTTGVATLFSSGATTVDWGAVRVGSAGWWRLWITGRPDTGTVRDIRVVLSNAAGQQSFAGDASTPMVQFMGPQIEYGSLTGYQPIGASPPAQKWVCEKWDARWINCNNNTITATFRQVFEG